jgi:hypothetical protein
MVNNIEYNNTHSSVMLIIYAVNNNNIYQQYYDRGIHTFELNINY